VGSGFLSAIRNKRTARTCIFCDQRATSREHLLPLWLQGLLNPGEMPHEFGDYASGSKQKWRPSRPDFKARIVCKECNTGWMSDLETATQPFLTSMIRGHGRTLYATG